MTTNDWINLIASISSLILSVIAIAGSIYFYTKSKDSEKVVELSLKDIRSQTGALERLTGKWMDRFTSYATNPKPADETTTLLLSMIKEMPIREQIQPLDENIGQEAMATELIDCYIIILYYSAIANISAQNYLPDIEGIEEGNPIKSIIDSSYADFNWLQSILDNIDIEKIESSKIYSHYIEAKDNLGPNVRDSLAVCQSRSQAEN